ncbi:MAG: hypothetical protein JXR76_16955 [Deltaproteobacteria bacterium]|nr:hypothetical protein [Deltaproteobacteria bacterium]
MLRSDFFHYLFKQYIQIIVIICNNLENCTRDCQNFDDHYPKEECAQWIDAYNTCMLNASEVDWNCAASQWHSVIINACRFEATSLFMCERTGGASCVPATENDADCVALGKPPHYHYCISNELALSGCVSALTDVFSGGYCCP